MEWRIYHLNSAMMVRVFLYVVILTRVCLVDSYLNLYISKEDLKNDLFLDFGNDIYILSDGNPAPLLSNPKAFKNLIAPLPPSIAKIKFHWDAKPIGDFSNIFEKKIKYSLELSSSDTEVMARPKASIASSDTLHLPKHMPEFNIEFPCSGKKDGLVDLGFHFNYSINSSDISHQVTIIVRRHCYKIEVKNISALILNQNISTSARQTVTLKSSIFSNNTLLGIILGGSALILSILIIFILRYIQERNKRLHMKFDIDYELKMKEREQEDLLNSFNYEIDLLKNDEKELLKDKNDRIAKPIYIPTTKKHRRWKLGRRKHHFGCKGSLVCHTTPSLENIIEEEDESPENDFLIDKERPVVLNLNIECAHENKHSTNLTRVNCTENQSRIDNHVSIEKDKETETIPSNNNSTSNQNIFVNNHVQHGLNVHVNMNKLNDEHCKMFKFLNDEWSVIYSKYILFPSQVVVDERFITKDSFSQIHRGKIKGFDKTQPSKLTPISVKIMLSSNHIDSIRAFMYEAYIMKKFNHENLLDLLGVVLRPLAAPLIVTSHMRHSDLNQLLRNSRATPRHHQTLSTRQLINFAVQISNGMKYLANKGYVHRVLCTQNIMVNSAFTVKIGGLGFAREIKKQDHCVYQDISQFDRWQAVESISESIYNEKSDVWSFGVVLWELMTFGKQPYPGLNDSEIKGYLLDYHRLSSPPNCPDMIVQIMFNCWQQLPKERPSFSELFERLSGYEDKYKKYVAEYIPPPTKIIS